MTERTDQYRKRRVGERIVDLPLVAILWVVSSCSDARPKPPQQNASEPAAGVVQRRQPPYPSFQLLPEATLAKAIFPVGARGDGGIEERYRPWLDLYDQAGFPDVTDAKRIEVRHPDDEAELWERDRVWATGWWVSTVIFDDHSYRRHKIHFERSVPRAMVLEPTILARGLPDPWLGGDRVDYGEELDALLAEATEREPSFSNWGRRYHHRWEPLPSNPVLWLFRARWAQMKGRNDLAARALAELERVLTSGCDCGAERVLACDQTALLRAELARHIERNTHWALTYGLPWTDVARHLTIAMWLDPPRDPYSTSNVRLTHVRHHLAESERLSGSLRRPFVELDRQQRIEVLVHLLPESGAELPYDKEKRCCLDPVVELKRYGNDAMPWLATEYGSTMPVRMHPESWGSHVRYHVLWRFDVSSLVNEQWPELYGSGGDCRPPRRTVSPSWLKKRGIEPAPEPHVAVFHGYDNCLGRTPLGGRHVAVTCENPMDELVTLRAKHTWQAAHCARLALLMPVGEDEKARERRTTRDRFNEVLSQFSGWGVRSDKDLHRMLAVIVDIEQRLTESKRLDDSPDREATLLDLEILDEAIAAWFTAHGESVRSEDCMASLGHLEEAYLNLGDCHGCSKRQAASGKRQAASG